MSEKAIWITIEEPATAQEMEKIINMLESTELSDRYELIVTGDRIDTIDMDELRELIGNE